MRALIIFYSRTGTTRRLAERIAVLTGAEREELVEPRSRRGILGSLRSAYEAARQKATPIEPIRHDRAAYDVIVVGTPVWCDSVSPPVRTLLERLRGTRPALAFFCTCGQKGERALAQMARIAGREPIATLSLTSDQVARGVARSDIDPFAVAVNEVEYARPVAAQ
jgi:flavodoxin